MKSFKSRNLETVRLGRDGHVSYASVTPDSWVVTLKFHVAHRLAISVPNSLPPHRTQPVKNPGANIHIYIVCQGGPSNYLIEPPSRHAYKQCRFKYRSIEGMCAFSA